MPQEHRKPKIWVIFVETNFRLQYRNVEKNEWSYQKYKLVLWTLKSMYFLPPYPETIGKERKAFEVLEPAIETTSVAADSIML